MTRSKNLALAGDFSIDLLKVNTNEKFQEFYDFLTCNTLLPNMTLPTRMSKHNATLNDHIYSKTSNSLVAIEIGILTHKISDHMATFTAINLNIIIHKKAEINKL